MRAALTSTSPVLWRSVTLPPCHHSHTITAAFPATIVHSSADVSVRRTGRAPGRGKARDRSMTSPESVTA
jgi:hypothetical protein